MPESELAADCDLPELSQLDVVRHFLALSQRNFGIDSGFYPLGSCTMKYNPKVNDQIARLPGFAEAHPLQDTGSVQGNLALMFSLQEWLAEIGGFAGVALQPAANFAAKGKAKKDIAKASTGEAPAEQRAPAPPGLRCGGGDLAPLPTDSDSLPPPAAADPLAMPSNPLASPEPSPTPEATATP